MGSLWDYGLDWDWYGWNLAMENHHVLTMWAKQSWTTHLGMITIPPIKMVVSIGSIWNSYVISVLMIWSYDIICIVTLSFSDMADVLT